MISSEEIYWHPVSHRLAITAEEERLFKIFNFVNQDSQTECHLLAASLVHWHTQNIKAIDQL